MGIRDEPARIIGPQKRRPGSSSISKWLSGKRTTSSSRRCTRCATPRWLSGWKMWRSQLLASWLTKFTPQQNSSAKEIHSIHCAKILSAQILEILMAERAKDQKKTEGDKLDALIQKHEELIPNVQKTSVMVDLYWKCYAYGDELKPHVEFLDGIMLSSTRDIAPSCIENVDELIERQEKSLSQLDSKKSIVTDLIAKGKVILQNPDKPKFLEANVNRIQDGWEDTKKKAQDRLQLLNETKNAFIGYAENSETIASDFEVD